MKITVLLSVLAVSMLISFFNSASGQRSNTSETNKIRKGAAFRSGYSEVNGIKMYWEAHGNKGNFLVLIHGGGSTIGTTFGRILPLLARDFRVIAVELQAHGHTGDRNAPESFEQDADDVAALLQNLSVSKASFFGFSNGGNTAMQIAIRHPRMVNKLIIASSFYKREGLQQGLFESLNKATLKDMPQTLKTAFLEITPDSSKLLNMFNKDRERMINFKDWRDDDLRSIHAPSLIICGDQDIVLPTHAVAMSKLIHGSRLMILPATHGSYIGVSENKNPIDNLPPMTVEIIKEFLNKTF